MFRASMLPPSNHYPLGSWAYPPHPTTSIPFGSSRRTPITDDDKEQYDFSKAHNKTIATVFLLAVSLVGYGVYDFMNQKAQKEAINMALKNAKENNESFPGHPFPKEPKPFSPSPTLLALKNLLSKNSEAPRQTIYVKVQREPKTQALQLKSLANNQTYWIDTSQQKLNTLQKWVGQEIWVMGYVRENSPNPAEPVFCFLQRMPSKRHHRNKPL